MVHPQTSNAWKQLSSDPLIAVCDYSFGAGTANALVAGVDGGVIVVSPPCRVADRVLDAAAAFGSVRHWSPRTPSITWD